VEIGNGGAEGVLLSAGSRFGGYSLYVKDGRLCYDYNLLGRGHYKMASGEEVVAGVKSLSFAFEKTGTQPFGAGGNAKLLIDGRIVAESQFPMTVPLMFGLGEAVRCGWDQGANVSDDYDPPFRFTGKLKQVIVEVEGRARRDTQQEAAIGLARQ
jgi:arylsulfatase